MSKPYRVTGAHIRILLRKGLPDTWAVNGTFVGSLAPGSSRIVAYKRPTVGQHWPKTRLHVKEVKGCEDGRPVLKFTATRADDSRVSPWQVAPDAIWFDSVEEAVAFEELTAAGIDTPG